MPVLQVPAGEQGCLGGLPILLKEEREENGEGKKEDDNEEEKMEGKRRDEEEMQDSLVMEGGNMDKFPLKPLPLVFFP